MSDDPIARAALGMAAALRERCPGCKAGLRLVPGDGLVAAWYHVSPSGDKPQCRLYDDERRALVAYQKAATS